MHIAIFLAGPSLATVGEPPAADLTIAVKRAATRYAADWLVVLDSPDLRANWMKDVIGLPSLLTRGEYRPKYTTAPGINTEELEPAFPHHPHLGGTRWGCFSSAAALVLAAHLGATHITAYGADFGEGDTMTEFDGFESPEKNYSAERWHFEHTVWDATIAALSLEVTRHGFAR